MPVALFGITDSGLNLFVNLVILFLIVVWIALIAWTYLDARRRISDSVLVACATGASVFPFVGTVVYTILRPPEFLEDSRERELEMRAAELRVRQLEEQSCQNCGFPVERNFLRCPSCRTRVKDPCYSCGQPIDPRWSVCPYCEASVRPQPAPAAAESGRGARPRATRPSEMPAREPGRAPRTSTSAARAAADRSSARQPSAASQRKAPAQRPAASQRKASVDGQEPASERPAAKARATRPARRSTASSSRSSEPKQPPRRTTPPDSGE